MIHATPLCSTRVVGSMVAAAALLVAACTSDPTGLGMNGTTGASGSTGGSTSAGAAGAAGAAGGATTS
ncbi:MAG TPA: hypothetical protein VHL80_07655, partial [Polyangia bacterium]|nr:hypothetical protein [Polyangia bacterium]